MTPLPPDISAWQGWGASKRPVWRVDGVLSRRPDFFRHVGISGRWNAFLMYFFQHGEELVRRPALLLIGCI